MDISFCVQQNNCGVMGNGSQQIWKVWGQLQHISRGNTFSSMTWNVSPLIRLFIMCFAQIRDFFETFFLTFT